MGKNLDTDSIFGSYINNVLLKEAVKPIESTAPAAPLTPQERAYADSAKAQGKNWTDAQAKLMFAQQNRAKAQAGTANTQSPVSPTSTQPVSNSIKPVPQGTTTPQAQPVSQPATTASIADTEDWGEPTQTTTQVIPNAIKTSTVATPNTSSIRPAAGASIADTEDWGEPTQTTTQVIPNATQTTSIAAGDEEFEQNDEDAYIDWEKEEPTVTSVERIPNATQTTSIAAGDDEIAPYQKKKNKINEKVNISKFLKHLSEKNYSSAHKYLKAVLNSKINNIVAERINKNFN